MSIKITGIKAELARVKLEAQKHQATVMNNVGAGIEAAVKAGMSRTPVFSGEAVRNYRVGISRVLTAALPPVQGRIPWPPSGPLPPDTRNEARRGANEAAVMSEVMAVRARLTAMKKLPKFISIRNTSDIADLIENGSAPSADRSRYPGGVSVIMRQALVAAAKGSVK